MTEELQSSVPHVRRIADPDPMIELQEDMRRLLLYTIGGIDKDGRPVEGMAASFAAHRAKDEADHAALMARVSIIERAFKWGAGIAATVLAAWGITATHITK